MDAIVTSGTVEHLSQSKSTVLLFADNFEVVKRGLLVRSMAYRIDPSVRAVCCTPVASNHSYVVACSDSTAISIGSECKDASILPRFSFPHQVVGVHDVGSLGVVLVDAAGNALQADATAFDDAMASIPPLPVDGYNNNNNNNKQQMGRKGDGNGGSSGDGSDSGRTQCSAVNTSARCLAVATPTGSDSGGGGRHAQTKVVFFSTASPSPQGSAAWMEPEGGAVTLSGRAVAVCAHPTDAAFIVLLCGGKGETGTGTGACLVKLSVNGEVLFTRDLEAGTAPLACHIVNNCAWVVGIRHGMVVADGWDASFGVLLTSHAIYDCPIDVGVSGINTTTTSSSGSGSSSGRLNADRSPSNLIALAVAPRAKGSTERAACGYYCGVLVSVSGEDGTRVSAWEPTPPYDSNSGGSTTNTDTGKNTATTITGTGGKSSTGSDARPSLSACLGGREPSGDAPPATASAGGASAAGAWLVPLLTRLQGVHGTGEGKDAVTSDDWRLLKKGLKSGQGVSLSQHPFLLPLLLGTHMTNTNGANATSVTPPTKGKGKGKGKGKVTPAAGVIADPDCDAFGWARATLAARCEVILALARYLPDLTETATSALLQACLSLTDGTLDGLYVHGEHVLGEGRRPRSASVLSESSAGTHGQKKGRGKRVAEDAPPPTPPLKSSKGVKLTKGSTVTYESDVEDVTKGSPLNAALLLHALLVALLRRRLALAPELLCSSLQRLGPVFASLLVRTLVLALSSKTLSADREKASTPGFSLALTMEEQGAAVGWLQALLDAHFTSNAMALCGEHAGKTCTGTGTGTGAGATTEAGTLIATALASAWKLVGSAAVAQRRCEATLGLCTHLARLHSTESAVAASASNPPAIYQTELLSL